ncbi:MAG: sugar transferase [Acidimicrobiales bacterium]
MSVGQSYQSWVDTRTAEVEVQGAALRANASASAAMAVLSLLDAVLFVALVAAAGLPLAAWWSWAAVAAGVGTLALTGHYRPRITLSVAQEAGELAACASLPFLILALAKVNGPSTAWLVMIGAVAAASVIVSRCAEYWLLRVLRTRGWFAERTLIVGAGDVSATLASTLDEHPEYGLRPVGFLDEVDSAGLPLPLFGGVDMLRMVLTVERIDRVIVGFGVTREAEMVDVFRACEKAAVEIHILPRFFELATAMTDRNVDDVWGFPLLHLRRSLLRRNARALKRVFDASMAALALLVVAPLYVVIAAVVKLTSPGPVHFRQQRVGVRGAFVDVLKFRSMYANPRSDVEWRPVDDRVTSIGHVLRVTGLDELPQLWNILKGDMSFVGPRPERPFFVEQFKTEVPRYDARHRVPVGLTGLAQVHGLRGDTPIDERVRLDNQYIENWSLWHDLVILLQTASAVIRNTFEPSRSVKQVHDGTGPFAATRSQGPGGGAEGPTDGLMRRPVLGRSPESETYGRPHEQSWAGYEVNGWDGRDQRARQAGARAPGHQSHTGADASGHRTRAWAPSKRPANEATSPRGLGRVRTRPYGIDPAERRCAVGSARHLAHSPHPYDEGRTIGL